MNSPVLQNILLYIQINKSDNTPIYIQIANSIINAIQTKAIKQGDKLPGTRLLSEKIFVHRNTVISAYNELMDQGWIEIKPQKGAFITSKKIKIADENLSKISNDVKQIQFPITPNYILDSPYEKIDNDLYFTDGSRDCRLDDWKSLQQINNMLTRKKSMLSVLNKNFHTPNFNLIQQIKNYIYVTKQLNVDNDQIICFQNYQIAFQSIVQTILKSHDKILVIDIGHFETNMKFKNAQLNINTVRTNSKGIDTYDLIEKIENFKPKALYIQSNLLYPRTIGLNDDVKNQLISLAHIHNFIIIEDDNSTDFLYAKTPISTLKKLDKYGVVIYLNSLGYLLNNPYDYAYVLAPISLIRELQKVKNIWQSTSTYLIEETIAEYIKEGWLIRHLQKKAKIYHKRRDQFEEILSKNFENLINFQLPKLGLGFWVEFNQTLSLTLVAQRCAKKGLTIPHYLLYQNQELNAIRLGFGHLNEIEMAQAIEIFSQCVYEEIYN